MKYTQPEKILIIRLSSIGDIILSTPLIRILRQSYPNADIDFIIKSRYRDLLYTNPHISNLMLLDTDMGRRELERVKDTLLAKQYDWIVDIHDNFRSRFLTSGQPGTLFRYKKYRWFRFLLIAFKLNLYPSIIPVTDRYINSMASVGITNDHAGTEFYPDADVLDSMYRYLLEKGALARGPVIAVAPGAGFPTKRWPVEYYTELIKQLMSSSHVVLLGDSRDIPLTQTIADECGEGVSDLAGKLGLMQTACVLEHARLFVGNDSGLMHLAGALGKKTISIFGPTTRELGFFPQQPDTIVVENMELNCRPCTHIGSNKCPKGHFKCMRDIAPQHVLENAKQLLNS